MLFHHCNLVRSVVEWIIIAKEMETQSVVEETIPTKKLYDEDAYCREFRARVLSCKRLPDGSRNLILDQSAFFPEAGGQSCDTGWVWQEGASPLRVSQVRLQDGILIHTVVEQADPRYEGEVAPGHEEQVAPRHEKQAAPGHEEQAAPGHEEQEAPGQEKKIAPGHEGQVFQAGTEVFAKLDFEDRYDKMQQHTGEHIFSGLVNHRYGYHNVGFHLGDDEVTMDFDGRLEEEEIRELEETANRIIRQNLPVTASFPSAEEQEQLTWRSKKEIDSESLRLVTIPGVDVCACCAPHVKRTGEVNLLKVESFQNYKKGTRIFLCCGERAYHLFQKEHRMVRALAQECTTSYENLPDRFHQMQQEILQCKLRASGQMEELLSYRIQELPKRGDSLVLFLKEGEEEGSLLRKAANQLMQKGAVLCAVFSRKAEGGFSFVIGSPQNRANECLQKMKEAFAVRGGGSPEMVQGSVQDTTVQELEVFFSGFRG